MDTPLHSSFLPMPLDASLEPFRVEGTLAVRALVRELINAHALVTVFAAEDPDIFVITCIRSLEADALELDVTAAADVRQKLLQAPFLTVVGVAGSVKIQFRVTDVERLELQRRPEGSSADSLIAPLPSHGWRVQRRNAFRVSPPAADEATVAVRLAGEGEVAAPLTDLSVGGLAMLWPAEGLQPAAGRTLRHCRIESVGSPAIPCDLRVIRVERAGRQGGTGQARVSCEFESMPQAVSRLVQMYVMDIEKRARLKVQRA